MGTRKTTMRGGEHRVPKKVLGCRKCGAHGETLVVAGAGNTRRIGGKTRKTQHVRCLNCGNEWDSYHQEALRRGKEADRLSKQMAKGNVTENRLTQDNPDAGVVRPVTPGRDRLVPGPARTVSV